MTIAAPADRTLGESHAPRLKLVLTSEELQELNASPLLVDAVVGLPATRTLRSLYFDTPDQRLRQARICLRLRSDGEYWVQSVMGETKVENGDTSSPEIETVLPRPEPDLNAIKDAKLRRKVSRVTEASVLEVAFETVVKRTSRQLHTDTGDLELVLDEGVVRSGKLETPICEAELELKSGAAASLLRTAAKIFADIPFRFADNNKAEQGYKLISGWSREGPASLHARPIHLSSSATCRDALAAFMRDAEQQIMTNRVVVLTTDDPEGPHQLRVGLRRLRNMLDTFSPLITSRSIDEFDLHAKNIANHVGELRDADVLINSIYAPVAGLIKDIAALQSLKQALRDHRAQKLEAARAVLRSNQWSALQLYLALWPSTIAEEAALNQRAAKYSERAMRKAWRRVAKKGKSISELNDEQRHDMRKGLKRLRYTSELFEALYKPGDVQPFLKKLKRLQDTFGYINDVAQAKQLESVVESRCPDDRASQRAVGYVLGWHDAQASIRWKHAQQGWEVLEQTIHFWS